MGIVALMVMRRRLLDSRWAQSIPYINNRVYLDAIGGSDVNDGLSQNAPLRNFATAMDLIDSRYNSRGVIYANSTEASPVDFNPTSASQQFDLGDISIFPFPGTSNWHGRGLVNKFTSGWTSEGGGVYSRVDPVNVDVLYVESVNDGDGFFVTLTDAGATTTPPAGQFGVTGGNLYVRLPSDEVANDETIIHPRLTQFLNVRDGGIARLYGGILRYSRSAGVFLQGTDSKIAMRNCKLQYCLSNCLGMNAASVDVEVIAHNCQSERSGNDGWNSDGSGIMRLTNCEASFCDDDGLGTHGDSKAHIMGGRYHHNIGGAGIIAIGDSVMEATDVRADNNFTGGNQPNEGGFTYFGNASGFLSGCLADNNDSPGYHCNTTGTVIKDVTSGVAQGNANADVNC